VATVALLEEVMTTAKVAGSCNAIRLGSGGELVGDKFDGEGFVLASYVAFYARGEY
jgi:shikimate dehydrogenase